MSAAGAHVVLSNYPLSRDFRLRIEEHCGAGIRHLNISELRQVSLLNLLRGLWRIRAANLSVATEDEASAALLPILELLAALTRARRLETIDRQLERRPFSRARAALHGAHLAAASLRALLDLLLTRVRLQRLIRAPRAEAALGGSRRVAYLNCNLWFGLKAGGSVGHVSGVANSLMDAGYELLLFNAGGRLLVDERARFVPLPLPRMLAVPVDASQYRFGRRCFAAIRGTLRHTDVRFIYQRLSLGNFTGVALSRRLKVPLVLEYNGSEVWVSKNWGRAVNFHDTAALAENVNIRHAHLIVTVSDVLRDELLARGVEPERIVSYPNCIDPKTFNPARFAAQENARTRREMGFEPGDVVATFIGTFGQWHGVDVLAQAIRRMVLERRPLLDALRLRFLLIGDGQKMPIVRETLALPEAGRYVRLAGLVPQHEAPRFLAASDLLLSPHVANADGSRFFGSPTKLFEYMAMGRGIVASDLDQIGEVLRPAVVLAGAAAPPTAWEDGAVAVLVPPGDAEGLMNGIELLAGDEKLRSALGRNARRLALNRYTWAHHVGAILSALERVENSVRPHGIGRDEAAAAGR
ncbi:MAG TPA: glycosyltransferase family 4 protein [Steroidobacteraceae bacterium]|jgi:glycosyltransferase involved in cell wall biosynthesis